MDSGKVQSAVNSNQLGILIGCIAVLLLIVIGIKVLTRSSEETATSQAVKTRQVIELTVDYQPIITPGGMNLNVCNDMTDSIVEVTIYNFENPGTAIIDGECDAWEKYDDSGKEIYPDQKVAFGGFNISPEEQEGSVSAVYVRAWNAESVGKQAIGTLTKK